MSAQVSLSQLVGSGSMLTRENLNFKSSEMARNGSKTVLALVVRWGPWGNVVVQLWILKFEYQLIHQELASH